MVCICYHTLCDADHAFFSSTSTTRISFMANTVQGQIENAEQNILPKWAVWAVSLLVFLYTTGTHIQRIIVFLVIPSSLGTLVKFSDEVVALAGHLKRLGDLTDDLEDRVDAAEK